MGNEFHLGPDECEVPEKSPGGIIALVVYLGIVIRKEGDKAEVVGFTQEMVNKKTVI
jgi:hypothetical protein